MVYRDKLGPNFNLDATRKQVESTLNKHKGQLILDGCSKGAVCGCRVKVRFAVELSLPAKSTNDDIIHREIYLFPKSERADAQTWAEEFGSLKNIDGTITFVPVANNNIIAHEVGHLFNFPDEYWKDGGWVHKMYVTPDHELDLELGEKNRGQVKWQIESQTNLMGYGAWIAGATVTPSYLTYVRNQFCELTGKSWRIG